MGKISKAIPSFTWLAFVPSEEAWELKALLIAVNTSVGSLFFLMLRKQRKRKRMFWTTVFSTCIFSSIQLYSLRLRNGASLDSYYSWKEEFPPLPLNVSDTLSLLFPCPTVEITLTQNQKIITRKLQTVFLKKKNQTSCYYCWGYNHTYF